MCTVFAITQATGARVSPGRNSLTNKVLLSKMRTRCSTLPKVLAVTLLRFWSLHKVGTASLTPQAHRVTEYLLGRLLPESQGP